MADNPKFLGRFMKFTDHLQLVFGPADHSDIDGPVLHRHDDFEHASEEDLAQFEVETDSEGHHYGTCKPHVV